MAVSCNAVLANEKSKGRGNYALKSLQCNLNEDVKRDHNSKSGKVRMWQMVIGAHNLLAIDVNGYMTSQEDWKA